MMKERKTIYAVVVSVIVAAASFAILIFSSKIRFGDMVEEYVNTDIYSVLSEKNVSIRDGISVRQEFVCGRSNIYSFSLKIMSEDVTQSQELCVEFYNTETEEKIQEWEIDASDIGFDGYYEFVLDKELKGVRNQVFAIEIKSDNDNYVLGGTQDDTIKGGTLYVESEEQEGDLAIKLSAVNRVWITLFYGIAFCILLGAAAGICVYFFTQKKLDQKIQMIKKIPGKKRVIKAAAGTVLFVVFGICIEKIFLCSGLLFSNLYGGFNEYRCAFLIVVMLLLFYMFIFRDDFEKKPERLFLLSFFLIGMLFVISMPGEAEISWDESIHYWRAAGVSHALDGRANYAESWLYWHSGIGYTLPNSIESLRGGQMNIQNLYNMGLEKSANTSILSDWSMLAYLPSAIGLSIGRLLRLPYALVFHLGAAMNMLVYITVLYYAMKRLSSGKMILAAIGGIPVSMFLASVYSYDSWVVAFSVLGMAYLIGSMQDGKVRNVDMIVMLVSFSLAFTPKEIYFPLFLIYLLIPKKMFESKRKHLLFCITTISLFFTYGVGMVIGLPYIILVFAFFWIVIYFLFRIMIKMNRKTRILVMTGIVVIIGIVGVFAVYKVLPQMLGQGDLRGGEKVNSAAQVRFIMENPVEYSVILLRFLKNQYLAFQVEVQGLFNTFGYIGKSSCAVMSFVLLWIVAFTDKRNEDIWQRYNLMRLAAIMISFITVCLIATGLYVSFTPVGLNTVQGCQIRYVMPLMFPVFSVAGFNRIQNNMSEKYYNALVIMGISGLLLLNLWDIVIRFYS